MCPLSKRFQHALQRRLRGLLARRRNATGDGCRLGQVATKGGIVEAPMRPIVQRMGNDGTAAAADDGVIEDAVAMRIAVDGALVLGGGDVAVDRVVLLIGGSVLVNVAQIVEVVCTVCIQGSASDSLRI